MLQEIHSYLICSINIHALMYGLDMEIKKEMRLIETSKYWSGIKVLINWWYNCYKLFYSFYTLKNDNDKRWKRNHIFNVLSDIVLSLKCVAFVATRASNINRLIDEFRSTSDSNSNIPYFEMVEINNLTINNSNLEIPEYLVNPL